MRGSSPATGPVEPISGNLICAAYHHLPSIAVLTHLLRKDNPPYDHGSRVAGSRPLGGTGSKRDAQGINGRTTRGLDIRFHDIQTGCPREISTLSGGETFVAALSLALGLSDIGEMCHGRIRLDTIVIDEDFGSFDTENDSGTLDLVLQGLEEIVGKSCAVGLTSHVPLVQQAVPNGFSIVTGVGGGRVERRAA